MFCKPCYSSCEKEKYDIARRNFSFRQCLAGCLDHISANAAIPVFVTCLKEVEDMTAAEKHDYIFQKLVANTIGVTKGGYLKCEYNLGVGLDSKLHGVCAVCFQSAYEISDSTLKRMRAAIRQGQIASAKESFTDECAEKNPLFVKLLCQKASMLGYSLDRRQVAAMLIPNTVGSLCCFSWMHDHFDMVADCDVTSPSGIMELEPIAITEVYEEYVLDMGYFHESPLSLRSFCRMWRSCFSHVRIREFKAVTGKCHTCAMLSLARKTHKDHMAREHLKLLHLAHRSAYMNERLTYYDHRQKAMDQPRKYLSIITDGMQQRHNVLPWFANIDSSSSNLPQHLQGVLLHGRSMQVYRTYHNVLGGANQQIHSVLMSLERVLKEEQRLPDTIFLQIDGGSENIAKSVLAMCELIVARGLTKKIVLSRLMVGHTHEDIDSKFALIWRRIRSAFALCMSHYKDAVEASISSSGLPCNVIDVLAVPDYDAFLRPHIDPEFGRYAKRVGPNDWTALQFTFEAVEDESLLPFFPLGVKCTYRKYSNDRVATIVKDDKAFLGMTIEYLTGIKSFPEADPVRGLPEGFYVMSKLPTSELHPERFIPGSREELESITKSVLGEFNGDATKPIRKEWRDFLNHVAPSSDDVDEFVQSHPLHIPLKDELFAGLNNFSVVDAVKARVKSGPSDIMPRQRIAIALDSVQHSTRRKRATDPSNLHPTRVIEGPRGVSYSEPVYCREKHLYTHKNKKSNSSPDQSHNERSDKKSGIKLCDDDSSSETSASDASENQSEVCSDSSSTDFENEEDGWVVCKKARLISRYGDPHSYIGKVFRVIPKYANKAAFAEKCSDGRIFSVVRRWSDDGGDVLDDSEDKLFFQCYNPTVYPNQPPEKASADWVYVKCKDMMSSDVSRSMRKWIGENTRQPRPAREKRQTWEYTTAPPSALFDNEPNSTSSGRKLRSGKVCEESVPDKNEEQSNDVENTCMLRQVESSKSAKAVGDTSDDYRSALQTKWEAKKASRSGVDSSSSSRHQRSRVLSRHEPGIKSRQAQLRKGVQDRIECWKESKGYSDDIACDYVASVAEDSHIYLSDLSSESEED